MKNSKQHSNRTDDLYLTIGNKGEDIKTSNYWGSAMEQGGVFFISVNAGAYRLLWPRCRRSQLSEMKTAKEVVISLGWSSVDEREMIEILFDDHSPSPYVLFTSPSGIDRCAIPESVVPVKFSVWMADYGGHPVCKLRRQCYVREVPEIPCLKPANEAV